MLVAEAFLLYAQVDEGGVFHCSLAAFESTPWKLGGWGIGTAMFVFFVLCFVL